MLKYGSSRAALIALSGWAMPTVALGQDDVEPVEVAQPATTAEAPAAEFEAALLRTWTDGDLTMIDGLAQVPLAMMAGGTTGAYRFELTVFDANDTQLYRDSWERSLSNRATAFAGASASTILEPFRFGVHPGEYKVEIRAYPTDAPDLGSSATIPVSAFGERPMASDLYLADRVEPLDEQGGGSWSITHGGFGISAVARTAVTPMDPNLYYYVEFYGADEETSQLDVSASVVNEVGKKLYTTPSRPTEVPVGGLPFAGSLSLEGLPAGMYELELSVKSSDETVRRSAPFKMLDAVAAQPVTPDSYESRYFQSLSAQELEETFGGVGYLVTESERQAYESLPPDAKRRYLTEFFAGRNPTQGAMGNSFLEEYLDRIGTVRMRYGEMLGTGERPPWTTDAGRIYLRFGEPSERVVNHFPSGSDTRSVGGIGNLQGEAPYEIWSYHSTGFVYLFVEESQFGRYRMIYTNDPNMRSLADWQDRAGGEAIRELSTKFGIQPRF